MTRLRRSDASIPGISRRRCGKGFSYRGPDGTRLTDPSELERVAALVIPPAWTDVWICPWRNGHIQAVGTDAAGRRQYRYHDAWRIQRDQDKFERAIEFGRALPALRKAVTLDLSQPGLCRARILATGVRLLDTGRFRIGGEEYAEENDTFGVATLQMRHVAVDGDRIVFRYNAKGSIRRTVTIEDAEVRKVMLSLLRRPRRPRDDLLAWKEKGQWHNLTSAELNAHIKDVIGDQFSAKDFRTWYATVYAAAGLAAHDATGLSSRALRRTVVGAVTEVADILGNTPTICRSSYVDPRVIDRFEAGETIPAALSHAPSDAQGRSRARLERAVIDLLSPEAGGIGGQASPSAA